MILCTFSLQANSLFVDSPQADDIVIVEVNTSNPSCGTATGTIEIIANSSTGGSTAGYSLSLIHI